MKYNKPKGTKYNVRHGIRIKLPDGNNPFNEINRAKLENPYAKTEEKSQ